MQNSDMVPDFISANTPKALAKLMQSIQDTDQVMYPWTNIAQANDGKWYAWYIPNEPKA
jgi:hypothetical protein